MLFVSQSPSSSSVEEEEPGLGTETQSPGRPTTRFITYSSATRGDLAYTICPLRLRSSWPPGAAATHLRLHQNLSTQTYSEHSARRDGAMLSSRTGSTVPT